MRANRLRRRLTLLYCAASVASGVVLLLIITVLALGLPPSDVPATAAVPDPAGPARLAQALPGQLRSVRSHLLRLPGIALVIMAVLSLVAGWMIAGRLLRPVSTMTGRLRHISGRNVHERLAMPGPRDELKDLADTVDDLLGRLE